MELESRVQGALAIKKIQGRFMVIGFPGNWLSANFFASIRGRNRFAPAVP